MFSFFLTFCVWVLVIVIVVILYALACFTTGKEGTGRIVLRLGGYYKTLLVKDGYKLDADENIVKLQNGESPEYPKWMGGLRFVSFLKPLGIDRFLKRDMKFQKAGTSGIEDRNPKDVSDFLAGVDYPYAVQFAECYDTNNIAIDGHATMIGHIDNLYKSMYATTDFYGKALGLVLPAVRECFKVKYSFTPKPGESPIKNQDLDTFIWEYLSDPAKNPQPGSGLSVIEELGQKYSFVVVAFRVALIKPPPKVVEKATQKWEAQITAEAAVEGAKASAALLDDTNQALEAWKKNHPDASRKEIAAKQEELAKRAYIKGGGQNLEIHGLENATTAVVGGGGGAGILVGGGNKPGGKNPKNSGNPQGKNPSGGTGKVVPTQQDIDRGKKLADEYFTKYGAYPPWDPLNRKPN